MTIRRYQPGDLAAMREIWNEVVEAGNAFPQEDPLADDEQAAAFFGGQTYTAVADDGDGIAGLYILHPNNTGRCGHIANASFAVRAGARGAARARRWCAIVWRAARSTGSGRCSLTPSWPPTWAQSACTNGSASEGSDGWRADSEGRTAAMRISCFFTYLWPNPCFTRKTELCYTGYKQTGSEAMKRQDYISWDEYFMGVAILAAQRSDPSTRWAHAVSGENDSSGGNVILSTGYNGFPIGCSDDEYPWVREGAARGHEIPVCRSRGAERHPQRARKIPARREDLRCAVPLQRMRKGDYSVRHTRSGLSFRQICGYRQRAGLKRMLTSAGVRLRRLLPSRAGSW